MTNCSALCINIQYASCMSWIRESKWTKETLNISEGLIWWQQSCSIHHTHTIRLNKPNGLGTLAVCGMHVMKLSYYDSLQSSKNFSIQESFTLYGTYTLLQNIFRFCVQTKQQTIEQTKRRSRKIIIPKNIHFNYQVFTHTSPSTMHNRTVELLTTLCITFIFWMDILFLGSLSDRSPAILFFFFFGNLDWGLFCALYIAFNLKTSVAVGQMCRSKMRVHFII